MGLTTCPKCEETISEKATVCPRCNSAVKQKQKTRHNYIHNCVCSDCCQCIRNWHFAKGKGTEILFKYGNSMFYND